MHEHYNISDAEWEKLQERGVTIKDLFQSLHYFVPKGSEAPVSPVCLMLYYDNHGDFRRPPYFPHKKIAEAIFNCLETKEKFALLRYMDDDDE